MNVPSTPSTCQSAASLPEVLELRATDTPDALAYCFLRDGECAVRRVTYRELRARVLQIAGFLRHRYPREACVVLQFAPGLEVVEAFLACLYAGMVPVPTTLARGRQGARFDAIVRDCGAVCALTNVVSRSSESDHALSLDVHELSEISEAPPPEFAPVLAPELGYLQYTSGSTAIPKGVEVSQGSVLNNCALMTEALQCAPRDVFVTWLPYFHDLGLVHGLLLPVIVGGPCYVMAPTSFLVKPLRWLQALSRYGGAHTAAPNFAYELCALAAAQNARLSLDLRCWRTSINGAEPVRPATLRRFYEAFAPYGLSSQVQRPTYGLAEATLVVSSSSRERPQYTLHVDSAALERGEVLVGNRSASTRELASSGRTWLDAVVRITEPDSGTLCAPNRVGEIWVSGRSLARGYYRNSEASREIFGARTPEHPGVNWLRTGDLGFVWDGELFVTGRRKDLVIIRGRNYYPQDLELAASSSHPALAPDGAAAFAIELGLEGSGEQTERLIIVQELKRGHEPTDFPKVIQAIRAAVLNEAEVPVYAVALLRPKRLPKTSSGKVQRSRCRQALLDGSLDALVVDYAQDSVEEDPGTRTASLNELVARALRKPVERIHRCTPFCDAGLESVGAVQLAGGVERIWGLTVTPERLLSGMCLDELRALVETAPDGIAARTIASDTERAHVDLPFPVTDVQRAYLLGRESAFELSGVGCHGYVELESEALELERLERACQRLVERHGMLRVVFDGQGTQRILSEVPRFQIQTHDLRALSVERAKEALQSLRDQLSHRVFPVDRWPLFDVQASLLDQGRVRLHINIDLLALDAWSIGIISRDLRRFYEDPERVVPELGVTFRDCVLYDHAQREQEAYRVSQQFWQEEIARLPPAPDLPLARTPRSIGVPRFRRYKAELSRSTWERFKARVKRSGLTPSAAVLSAFAEVLGRFSAHRDFSLTLTLFDRPALHQDVYDLVGDFTTIALLGFQTGQARVFSEFARKVQDQLWTALDHRRVGAIRALRERGFGNVPIVFTSSIGQNEAEARAPFLWLGRDVFAISQTPQIWLDHQVSEDAGALILVWDVVDELFPPGFIADMFEAYQRVLESLASSDAAWSARSPVALPDAQQLRRTRVNLTEAPISMDLLHSGFCRSALERPEALALRAASGHVSYGELEVRSRAIAVGLRERGARPNQLVAIVFDKGIEQVLAALAVVRSGAAYLPVDPEWPAARRAAVLEQGAPVLVLTDERYQHELEWPPGFVITALKDCAAAEPPRHLQDAQEPCDLAYVIFTSGSTGKPKGVAIEHRAAVNTIVDLNARLALTPADRVLALSSLTFDLSVYDVFGVLAAGGSIVLPDAQTIRDPGAWVELMRRYGVTLWNSVPALMQMLVEHVRDSRGALPTLRAVMLSGDWIPVTLPDRVRTLGEHVMVLSLGGATEAAIWSIAYPIEQLEPEAKSVPYGTPLLNQRFYVLNEQLQPVPDWVPGRLYIAGIGLARGYHRNEAQTRERFVYHPDHAERMYWTGDLGRYRTDGNIEFLGREDFQVKIQGYRIELEEIETALLSHPVVSSAVVAARSAASGGKRLVAYIVPAAGARVDWSELRAFIAGKLPSYMVPNEWSCIAALPLSSNGKVDRSALPESARCLTGDATGAEIEALLAVDSRVGAVDVTQGADGRMHVRVQVPAEVAAAGSMQLHDPVDKLRFKLLRAARRRDLSTHRFSLGGAPTAEVIQKRFVERRSYRAFEPSPVDSHALGELLGALRALELPGCGLGKRAYGSAGGLYPVQIYIHVQADRVRGLQGGAYYYDPEQHALAAIVEPAGAFDRSVHVLANAAIFDSAAFSVILVLEHSAITPIYASRARDFALMEVGAICQLLEAEGPPLGLGLCQVGAIDEKRVHEYLGLGRSQEYLHGLVGGAITIGARSLSGLQRDSSKLEPALAAARERDRAAPLQLSDFAPGALLRAELLQRVGERYPGLALDVELVIVEPSAKARMEMEAPEGWQANEPEREPSAGRSIAPDDSDRKAGEARTKLEAELQRIWCEALRVHRVGNHDNFFDLGGDSLLLVAMARTLRERLGIEVPVLQLFENPTVSSQVKALYRLGAVEPGASAVVSPAGSDALRERAELQRAHAAERRSRRARPRNERIC